MTIEAPNLLVRNLILFELNQCSVKKKLHHQETHTEIDQLNVSFAKLVSLRLVLES